jgi:uncharacterized protein (TIGR03086 family)
VRVPAVVRPPSMTMTVPLTQDACLEARAQKGRERFLFAVCRVFLVEGNWQARRLGVMHVTELDRALRSTLAILAKVQPADLDTPTPCASWNVRGLINHFVGTARWWAGVLAGESDVTDADYAGGDFVAAYEESIQIALAAFEADGALDRTVRLPFGEFPGTVVRGMAALDQFTHGWDLARAIRYPTDLDPDLAARLLGQASMAITDAYRGADGEAPFGPVVHAPAGAGPADQLAAFLGRPV